MAQEGGKGPFVDLKGSRAGLAEGVRHALLEVGGERCGGLHRTIGGVHDAATALAPRDAEEQATR